MKCGPQALASTVKRKKPAKRIDLRSKIKKERGRENGRAQLGGSGSQKVAVTERRLPGPGRIGIFRRR